MSLDPIRTHGKFADAAYSAIRTGIRMGHIPPGTRLQEAELALQLGTSKTPVREALGRLVSDGLAATSGRTGMYVTRLSHDEIIDLYEAREIIEPQLARLAAERAAGSDVHALKDSLSSFEAALKANDYDSLMELDSQFHEIIASIAGNRMLAQARERLDNCIAIARVASIQKAHTRTSALALKEHGQIYDAISRQDGTTAEQRMAEHIRRRRDGLLGRTSAQITEAGKDDTSPQYDAPSSSEASVQEGGETGHNPNTATTSPPVARTSATISARSEPCSHSPVVSPQDSLSSPGDHARHLRYSDRKETPHG
ncbi:MAG: GntR family transcriptional regulator [Dehalococcoidia bacterium]|nr:GntR family transcriptional regulator [Dehalococcoidia bacterium]